MRLATRLWLHAGVLPAALLALALLASGVALDRLLVHAMDDALSAQAAVEAVSLFDLAGGAPHLHLDRSELARRLGEPPAETALYGADGRRVLAWPADAALPASVAPSEVLPREIASPQTVRDGDRSQRELRLTVRSPAGRPYLLLLRRSLAERDAALQSYTVVAIVALLTVLLTLFVATGAQVRGLAGRVGALVGHVARLERGELDLDPPSDGTADELAALRDALALATQRLRDARLAEERLIADAAHELRTPLATMRMELDLALRRQRSEAQMRDALARTGNEVDRLAQLTNRLLELRAGDRTVQRAPLDLAAVANASVARFRPLCADRGLSLAIDAPADAPYVGDGEAIGRALDNLLANAARFARNRLVVGLTAAPHGWQLRVGDDGPGVPEAEVHAVFAPFHRLDRSAPGAGLGLAIVADVARAHGGSVWVEQSPLGGACFVVSLA